MTATISPHFKLDVHAAANPDAVFYAPNARFSVLTPRLIRLEYSPDDGFEDRPSQPFWYRRQPAPDFSVREQGGILAIDTGALVLTYRPGSGFKSETLKIKSDAFEWAYGQENKGNLLGTYRTLDGISGNTPLEPGLLSRDGWALVDDSHTLVFNEDGWLEPRNAAPGTLDLYFFGHGRDYQAALRDYSLIAGSAPMIPRYVLGNWWSRYWEYSQDELQNLMLEFKRREVPLSVCIIDMDWHITNTPYHTGWTGYTWNPELFPDPPGFIAWLHQQGLHTAMNLHPAEGVAPHEAGYPALAKRLGMDPRSKKTIAFDIASPEFTKAYLEVLHHPHEADGVDFWWMDWQQGELSSLPGLDPLWWLNHIHYLDLGRNGEKRAFIFSRWGGLGSHRYPIGFSGDTHVDWPTLRFQPYFTATAANVRYGWWSHDIGGHNLGIEDAELYARWVQFGVFSPILRLHSTKNPFHERCPWGYDAETERVATDAMRLRQALIPYLYSMMWRDHSQELALVRPMYHLFPDREEAYACPGQYAFGSELIAAPYCRPADPDLNMSRKTVWLPQGDWYDFETGEFYKGGRWYGLYGQLEHIPVFAKAGAIVPLSYDQAWSETGNPEAIELRLFAGADNHFELYEDDGKSVAFKTGAYALTKIEQRWTGETLEISVHPPEGDRSQLPETRRWRLRIYGVGAHTSVGVSIDGAVSECNTVYDPQTGCILLDEIECPVDSTLTVHLQVSDRSTPAHRERLQETVMDMLRAFRMETHVKYSLAKEIDDLLRDPAKTLLKYDHSLSNAQKQALLEVITGAGANHIDYLQDEHLVVMWNPEERTEINYHYTTRMAGFYDPEYFPAESGVVPTFRLLRFPKTVSWQAWKKETRAMQWLFALQYGQAATLRFESGMH